MRIAPVKHYLNLTNGIESLPHLPAGVTFSFVRIQSTACEQKRWDFILQDLDSDLLLNLAVGTRCIIHDYSNKKSVPRAIYQGVEWIRYALTAHWLGERYPVVVRNFNAAAYFDEVYRQLQKPTRQKLSYFRKFVLTDAIRLQSMPARTVNDGKYDFYRHLLSENSHHAIFEEIA